MALEKEISLGNIISIKESIEVDKCLEEVITLGLENQKNELLTIKVDSSKCDSNGVILINIGESKSTYKKLFKIIGVPISMRQEYDKIYMNEKYDKIIGNSFDRVPSDLGETKLLEIMNYINEKVIVEEGQCRMVAYEICKKENEKLIATLFMINNTKETVEITKFPIKLTDANDKVIVKELFDLNLVVAPYKTSITHIAIDVKNDFHQIDLSKWNISFEV